MNLNQLTESDSAFALKNCSAAETSSAETAEDVSQETTPEISGGASGASAESPDSPEEAARLRNSDSNRGAVKAGAADGADSADVPASAPGRVYDAAASSDSSSSVSAAGEISAPASVREGLVTGTAPAADSAAAEKSAGAPEVPEAAGAANNSAVCEAPHASPSSRAEETAVAAGAENFASAAEGGASASADSGVSSENKAQQTDRRPNLLPKEHYSLGQKLHHLLFTAGSFAFFGVFGSILAWIILPRIYRETPGTPTQKSMACRERVSKSFRWLFRAMCRHRLFTLPELPAKEDLPADGRFVLIANHPSLVDMVILFACFPQVVIVAANYMFSNPILGPLLRRCEFIDGGDGGPFSGASVITAGIERINRGVPVLIFPEGTRSPISGFGAFRRGAFDMAKRAGVPIIPAYISTRPRTLMKGMPWYAIPAETVELRITLGEKIESPKEESTRALQKRVEADYRNHLKKIGLIPPQEAQQALALTAATVTAPPSALPKDSAEASSDGAVHNPGREEPQPRP